MNPLLRDSLLPTFGYMGFSPGHPLVLVFGFVLTLVLGSILIRSWFSLRKAEMDAALKQQMLERGMSAADIAQVLQASSPDDSRRPRRRRFQEQD